MEENRRHPDIGPDIEYANPIVQLDAVLQVAPRAEHLVVYEARFIGVQ